LEAPGVSYSTLLEMYVVGELSDGRDADATDRKTVAAVIGACRAAADAMFAGAVAPEVFKPLSELLQCRRVSVDHVERDLVPLLLALTAAHHGLTVGLRGLGEEFEDVWVRYYHRGRAFKRHPLDPLPKAPRPAGILQRQKKRRRTPRRASSTAGSSTRSS
jgi:hypothetical protein